MTLAGEIAAPSAASVEKTSLATVAMAILLVWLPIQTPLAIAVFQYGHAEILARGLLLAKDAFVSALIVYLFAQYWRRVCFCWFDWAAVVYVALVVLYSIVPWLLGSHISYVAVGTSAREFLVPVGLYGLGRLALLAGADVGWLVRWFLAVAAVAAAFTLLEWVLLPATFWSSTLDLVSFIRVVQGIPNATSLWATGILAQFGQGPAGEFSRAVGPFTHPVGTGHYFVLPLVLSVAWFYHSLNQNRRRMAIAMAVLSLLFAGAVIAPISRGSWIASGLAVLLCSLVYRRSRIVVLALVLTGAVIVTVPPLRYSITSVLNGTDASSQGHVEALDKGLRTVVQNPIGLGVGQSGQFGQVLSTGDSAGAGVGENMYLELWVSVGPLGLLAFGAWMIGLLWQLAAVRHRAPPPQWIVIGSAAALLGYAVSAMVSSPLMRFSTSASVWLVIGLCTGLVLASRPSAEEDAALTS